MPKIQINDISMYYEVHGQGEPIIFIGGFSSDHTIWQGIIEYLEKDYQLILFDNRGAGQTDAPSGPYSIKMMTEDLVSLCSKLGIHKAHFAANSMGGFILQYLAHHYPALVKSAIIGNSTSAVHTPFHFYLEAQMELRKADAPLESIIKAAYSWVFSFKFLSQKEVVKSLIQMTLNTPYPFTLQGYEGQYAALEGFDSKAWAGQIKVPTLVLAANQDLIFNASLVKGLADAIPDSQFYCFEECGHLPQVEYPKLYSEVLGNFIGNLK